MTDIVILYAPAFHEGYLRFLKANSQKDIYIVSDKILSEITTDIPYYGRDFRAVSSQHMLKVFRALRINKEVNELDMVGIENINKDRPKVIMPDEDISHEIAKRFFPNLEINFESIFLRWDKKISTTEFAVRPDRVISKKEFDRELICQAITEGGKSSDWWRQIGAIAVRDGRVLISAHNTHMPRPDNVDVLGDPRSNFEAGDASTIGLSTAMHAEAGVVAEAARQGLSLEGAHLYITTFPCPNCARLLARSGVKKVFYNKGYSLLDAEEILKIADVEIVMVDLG